MSQTTPNTIRVLLLSGPLSVGKSSVTKALAQTHYFERIRSGSYLASVAAHRGIVPTRIGLQGLGDSLDLETDFQWLIDAVAVPAFAAMPTQMSWIVDAVRKRRQVEHFKARFAIPPFHVHLVASEATLRQRYESRQEAGDDYVGDAPYDEAIRHPNEVASRSLITIADLVLDIETRSPQDSAREISARAEEFWQNTVD